MLPAGKNPVHSFLFLNCKISSQYSTLLLHLFIYNYSLWVQFTPACELERKMSPSPRKKLSELAGNLSPSREKASNAVQRVASAANDIWRHGFWGPPAQRSRENSYPSPRGYMTYYEIGRRISDPKDDKTMPPVVSNAKIFLRPGPDEPNANYYVRTYQPRVGFDTSENKNVTDFSFTMSSKHKNYRSTARSRTFLCGTDENDYSEFALEWLLEELVNEDDEIVCLRVVNPDTKTDVDASVLQEMYKEEARRLLDHFQKKNEDGIPISLVVELAVGKVEETIQAMVSTSIQVDLTRINDRWSLFSKYTNAMPRSRYTLQPAS